MNIWRVGEAGLLGGVAEVDEGEAGLRGLSRLGEVDGFGEEGIDVLPLGDEFFVDGVELVGFGGGEGEEACGWAVWGATSSSQLHFGLQRLRAGEVGGVGVVFEELGWVVAGLLAPA